MASILVIDDEAVARLAMTDILEHAGHHVEEADSGRTAAQLYRTEQFDVIITDIIMPDQDGIETILDVRRQNPAAKIIAVSGGGRGQAGLYLSLSKGLGASQILLKPFSAEELLAAVRLCLPG